jgi:hypothetical protein
MTPATKYSGWFWQAWLATVIFVYSVPHTIALRNVLLVLGVVVLVLKCRKSLPQPPSWLSTSGWAFAGLTAWILFHSVAIAPSPSSSLDQFRANWLTPLLVGFIGSWAAFQISGPRALRSVAMALAAHLIWLLLWQANQFWSMGGWPFKVTPFGAYDTHGTLISFLFSLLVVDRLSFVIRNHSPFSLGVMPGWLLLLICIASDVGLQSRNSTLVTLGLLLAASATYFVVHKRNALLFVLPVLVIAAVATGSMMFDKRWGSLRESASIGWSATGNQWINFPATDLSQWPKTTSGKLVDNSAYLRAAWARKSIDFIVEHPIGIGFGHDAFGRSVAMQYGHTGMGSSHSGWLDFMLGTGIPGLVLLLATGIIVIRSAWKRFRIDGYSVALLLGFFVGGYLFRCLLDGHFSGWRLGLFAFICGVLIAAMKPAPRSA